MIAIPNIIAKSPASCPRRQQPLLMQIIESNALAIWSKQPGLRGFTWCVAKLVGKEVVLFKYRVLAIKYDTVYFAHDIDHDHKTHTIRGVLCEDCNIGLGRFRDSPESLENAAAYLRRAYAESSGL